MLTQPGLDTPQIQTAAESCVRLHAKLGEDRSVSSVLRSIVMQMESDGLSLAANGEFAAGEVFLKLVEKQQHLGTRIADEILAAAEECAALTVAVGEPKTIAEILAEVKDGIESGECPFSEDELAAMRGFREYLRTEIELDEIEALGVDPIGEVAALARELVIAMRDVAAIASPARILRAALHVAETNGETPDSAAAHDVLASLMTTIEAMDHLLRDSGE